jgi:hypothetical protein
MTYVKNQVKKAVIFYLNNGVRRLLKESVKSSSSVRDFLEQNVELLALRRLAVGRAQRERQEVQHRSNNESSSTTHLKNIAKYFC